MFLPEMGVRTYLIVSEPDLSIGNREVDNMIDERLHSPGSFRHSKDLM